MARVCLRIGGVEFDIQKSLLERYPDGYLYDLCQGSSSSDTKDKIIVDRPAQSFAAILAYYQTGELHMPSGICPGAFKKELEFWKIGKEELSDCCYLKYQTFFDDQNSLEDFGRQMERKTTSLTHTSRSNVRERIWEILDYQSSSVTANVLYYVMIFMVLLTIILMALQTDPLFQRKLTKSELLQYMEESNDIDYKWNIDEMYENYEASEAGEAGDSNQCPSNDLTSAEAITATSIPSNISSNGKPKEILKLRIPIDIINYLEMATLAYFSIELIMRLICCPSLKIYFRSVVNVIDFLIIVTAYIHIIVDNVKRDEQFQINVLDLLEFVQMFRVLRLARIAKNITGCKVMIYTARTNFISLSLLFFYIFVAMCIFSSFLYFAETRDNIPTLFTAWWWAVVTMTTVGYGDYVPKSHFGRFVGSLCAVCGLLLLSSSIPIFVNNFLMFYQYDAAQVKRKKKGRVSIACIEADSKCNEDIQDIKVGTSDTVYSEKIKVISVIPKPARN
ncbi:hypothetical protein CHS0354_016175 [Potamilus streckersoni]|uniref:BTB domain-containing protein n=1 Tax=Potamilus streckersoni TaxID=2493646 RepID=A0AAE0RX58_9BIVA|nr:hypothetical protein CHS0354_016175 [Potamilus streckersoni]